MGNLILCGEASTQFNDIAGEHEVLKINQYTPKQNLKIETGSIAHALLKTISPIARDLLEIASFVYYADSSIKRGTQKDVWNSNWFRELNFIVPVREPEVWKSEPVYSKLVELLGYLTEDEYSFEFIKNSKEQVQLILNDIDKEIPFSPDADCVLLFSGGMDALSGAAYLEHIGRKPILVSHRSNNTMAKRQTDLAHELRTRPSASWSFPHVKAFVNRVGVEASEDSQRSRSFLFFALGTLVALEQGIGELVVAENGITSFNLPRRRQTYGSQATRTTHPQVLFLFSELIRNLFNTELKITTPFIWKTRAEVLEELKRAGCESLLPKSSSCAHARRRLQYPHCGTCSQCVDRRFAVSVANLDSNDELDGYETNIFTDSIQNPLDRAQVQSPLVFAAEILGMNSDTFAAKFGQVYEAIDYFQRDTDEVLQDIFSLHQRYANEIVKVYHEQEVKNFSKKFTHQLPTDCLLMMHPTSAETGVSPVIAEKAVRLSKELVNCDVSVIKEFQDVCVEIMNFLFCEHVKAGQGLSKPTPQSPNDQKYNIRDLTFENTATEGVWADVKNVYKGYGIIFDAKNYKNTINKKVVLEIAQYLDEVSLGLFGVILARKVPQESKTVYTNGDRIPSAVQQQKLLWERERKVVLMFDEEDLLYMLDMKSKGEDPSTLVAKRIFTLRSRM